MAVSLRKGFCVSCSGAPGLDKKKQRQQPMAVAGTPSSCWKGEFRGQQVALRDVQAGRDGWPAAGDYSDLSSVHVRASPVCVPRSMRWWERGATPNMVEIGSAQELVDSLLNAGDQLVVVDFYSPGCGGCKALHPKICQSAESNPDAWFLKVNYEEHRAMCCSLNVHVLPFFRFYRGSQGRVCSFSCTNATIKKFKDALAKHGTERHRLGPAKGLEESELLKLASFRELSFRYPLVSTAAINSLAADYAGGDLVGAAEGEELAALAM